MNKLLLHPKATLAIVIAACLSIDTTCGGIATSLGTLSHVHGFELLVPRIQAACGLLGFISNVAVFFAGVGRSFVTGIDTYQEAVTDGSPKEGN